MGKWSYLGYMDCRRIGLAVKVPFALGNDVSLIEAPKWATSSVDQKSTDKRMQRRIAKSKYVLRKDYEADIACDLQQDEILSDIHFARFAIWLARPTLFNVFFGAHFENLDAASRFSNSDRIAVYQLHKQDEDEVLTLDDLDVGKVLNVSISSIEKNTTIWIAIKFLHKALMENMWEVKYVLMWFAMEALFGCDQEITYRLSLRASMFLSDSKEVAKENFDKIKRGYGIRCTIVHGSKIKKLEGEESLNVLYDLQEFLRKALTKILLHQHHIETFNSSKRRNSYLDNLVFDA